jgi:hypothetical protein
LNQSESNCYAVASRLARHFGFEPASSDEIHRLVNSLKGYWAQRIYNPKARPPVLPRAGEANFVVRDGDELMFHVSFEYRGREYNYGAASREGFNVLFRIPLKRIQANP